MIHLAMTKAERRFFRKIQIDRNGCWLWTAATDKDGYGVFGVGDKYWRAHRFAWSIRNRPLEAHEQLHHLCETPSCANPDHLVLMTPKQHKQLHMSRITHCPYGHEYTPENTYVRPNGQRNCKACALEGTRKLRETPEGKEQVRIYRQSERGKEVQRRYRQTEHGKRAHRESEARRRVSLREG